MRPQTSIETLLYIYTVKPVIRVDFLFFLFGFSLDSHYRSTLIEGRLLLTYKSQEVICEQHSFDIYESESWLDFVAAKNFWIICAIGKIQVRFC